MTSATRWSATLALDWPPILTYERRRLEYLDWLEANVQPRGFLDEGELLGAIVGRRSQRLLASRDGAQLALMSPDAEVRELEATLVGAQQCFGIQHLHEDGYRGAWSQALDDELDIATAKLTAKLFPTGFPSSEARPTDGAVLADLATAWGTVQVEFGIVSANELRDRVSDPEMGRINPQGLYPSVSVGAGTEVPSVALFVDVYVAPTNLRFSEARAVIERFVEVETKVMSLVGDIASAIDS